MNAEQPSKTSIYDIDADYLTVNAAIKAIGEFYGTHYQKPDFLIVGSLTFVSIAHFLMQHETLQLSDVTSFKGVAIILDPTAPKDKATAIFASPKQVLSQQVTPDEVKFEN